MGKEMIRLEVQRRVAEKVESLDGSSLIGLAERLSGRNSEEIVAVKKRIAVKTSMF